MDYASVKEFGALFSLFVGTWVMMDANKRGLSGLSAFLWGLGAFLLLCAGLPLWLLCRPSVPGSAPAQSYKPFRPPALLRSGYHETEAGRCPACGGAVSPEDRECASCGIHFLQAPETVPPSA
jgi:hypothetical protein